VLVRQSASGSGRTRSFSSFPGLFLFRPSSTRLASPRTQIEDTTAHNSSAHARSVSGRHLYSWLRAFEPAFEHDEWISRAGRCWPARGYDYTNAACHWRCLPATHQTDAEATAHRRGDARVLQLELGHSGSRWCVAFGHSICWIAGLPYRLANPFLFICLGLVFRGIYVTWTSV